MGGECSEGETLSQWSWLESRAEERGAEREGETAAETGATAHPRAIATTATDQATCKFMHSSLIAFADWEERDRGCKAEHGKQESSAEVSTWAACVAVDIQEAGRREQGTYQGTHSLQQPMNESVTDQYNIGSPLGLSLTSSPCFY